MNARTLTLLAAAAVSILAASPGRGQDILEDVRWVSANNTDDGLSKSLVDLYIAMCRGGILRTRDVPSGGGKVESLLRTNRVHYGAALPVQIDELVCSLNPGFCRSNSGGTPANCGQSAAAGSATQPQWLYMPDATLVIPDIAFNEVIRLRPYRRPEGVAHGVDDLERTAVARGGCDGSDSAECRVWLQAANREIWPAIVAGTYTGVASVPTLTLSTSLSLQGNWEVYAALKGNLVSPVKNVLGKSSPSTLVDVGVDSLPERQRSIFRRIGHPDVEDGGMLPRVSDARVGIIDGPVEDHCLLAGSVVRQTGGTEAGIPVADARQNGGDPCPDGVTADYDPSNHGTHVAGIVGINAGSTILRRFSSDLAVEAYPVMVQGEPVGPVARQLFAIDTTDPGSGLLIKGERPNVFNLSNSYQPKAGERDPFGQALQDHAQFLFVVAAAQRAEDGPALSVEGQCQSLPGCLANTLPNVMMVAAIDDGQPPTIVPLTNYGTAIDLAAPGKDIPSTVGNNGIGLWSGTSQAAPWVAATAALIRASFPELRPVEIRNRLLATSDIYPHLHDALFGGILNVGRALMLRDDVIVLRPGATVWRNRQPTVTRDDMPTVIAGRMNHNRYFDLRGVTLDKWACGPYDAKSDRDRINLREIHRVHLNRQTGRYYIYYEPRRPCPIKGNGRLARVRADSLLLSGDRRLRMIDPADSAQIEVDLGDVEDFYRRTRT